jgi:hypothetical protein
VVRQGANDVSASESAGSVKFTISLGEGQCFANVSYQTVDGTAVAGQDYESKSGEVSLSFDQNPSQTVTVKIVDDTINEPDETFSLKLGGDDEGSGTATILDDDPPPSIAIGNATSGGGANEVFPVTLSGPSGFPISIDYATSDGTAHAGTDYQPVSGVLTFPPGTTQQSISVPVVGGEPGETFDMVLSAPQNVTVAADSALATLVTGTAPTFPSKGGGGGATPPSQTAPPKTDVLPPIIVFSTPEQRNGFLIWTVTCPVTEQLCTGTVKVTTTLPSSKPAAAAVSAKKKKKKRTVKLGSANYSLKGGQTKTVRVRINGQGRNLVRKHHNVPAAATFKTRDNAGNVSRRTQHITLHPVILRHS